MGRRRSLASLALTAAVAVVAGSISVSEGRSRAEPGDTAGAVAAPAPAAPTTSPTTEPAQSEAEAEAEAEGEREGALGGLLDGLEACGGILTGAGAGAGARTGGASDRAGQLREIADVLQEVRQLRFTRLPEPRYLSPDELERRVLEAVDEGYDPDLSSLAGRTLVALGALAEGTDFGELQRSALGEQVAGFYDPETDELVVGEGEGEGVQTPFGPETRITLAHELDHALTDQALGLDEGTEDGTGDEALAVASLHEGDATLTMQLYALRALSLADQLALADEAAAATEGPAAEELPELPYHLTASFEFPYFDGMNFVCHLHEQGGWKAVDAAYDAPPTTSAQVLFPERYLAREGARDPRDPSNPGQGWQATPVEAFGAAELLWLFEAPGGDPERALDDPFASVEAWSGGDVQTWVRGDDTAVALSLLERPGVDRRLCDSVTAWYRAAFPDSLTVAAEAGEALAVDGEQDAVLSCTGDEVRLGIAPDLPTARAMVG